MEAQNIILKMLKLFLILFTRYDKKTDSNTGGLVS